MVVRRPIKAKNFNGTVLVEWYNVTVGFDVEANWFRYHEEIVREGYAWVGISAQRVGVNYLKTWSPARYGSLDVTQGGTINNDALNWDIYSQALQAIRSPQGVSPLADLKVKRVIADGESSSASKLTQYYNAIHPLAGLADAFILNGAPEPNLVVRTDLATPVFKLTTETDVAVIGHAQNRQADSNVLRTWEVAGTSHADFDMIGDWLVPTGTGVNPVQFRDTGTFQAPVCDFPGLTRTPYKYVYHAVIEHVDRWIQHGTPPPHGTPLEVVSVGPGPRGAVLARDSFGIAKGGIRLSAVDAPDRDQCQPERPRVLLLDLGPVPAVRRSDAGRPVPDAREVRVEGRAGKRPEREGRVPAQAGRPDDQARGDPIEHRRVGRSVRWRTPRCAVRPSGSRRGSG